MRPDQLVRPDVRPADTPPDGRVSVVRPRRRPRSRRRQLLVGAVVLAVLLGLVGGFGSAGIREAVGVVAADRQIVPSQQQVLTDLWRSYKNSYLEAGTLRTLQPQQGGITTSQGESDTMLRAVWMDDQQTFAQSWQWTKDNLERDDHRLAQEFGQRPDGSYGIRTAVGGDRSATDADVDTAFALLMAYSRWKQDGYLYDALPIIGSVWDQSVVAVHGLPVLTSDDVQRANPFKVVVNPSSFAPYAYRVFAAVDQKHDWRGLVDNGYALLQQLDRQPLDARGAAGLPPDWVYLDRRTGQFSAVGGQLTTRFGHDALRLPWRLALDSLWYGDQRARELLERESVLARAWTQDHRLAAAYDRDGTPATDSEAPATYGGAMGYFTVVRPDLAAQLYAQKLLPLYDLDTEAPAQPLGFYDASWVWFGMALQQRALPNLTVTQR